MIRHGLEGTYPEVVNPAVSRDFIYVDDVTEACSTALNLAEADFGESFNIGTGRKTTIGEVAALAGIFGLTAEPSFTMPERPGRPGLVRQPRAGPGPLGWEARTCFCDGLRRCRVVSRPAGQGAVPSVVEEVRPGHVYSVSAIVSCYDDIAIPIMYERLRAPSHQDEH